MKNAKTLSILILAAFVVSTIATIPIPTATAAATPTQKTYPIVDAIPNPIWLGRSTLLKCGISEALPSASYGWTGITITVTKPDGTTETLGPFTTDSTGATYTTYTPDQVGNYTITTNFPNNTYPFTYQPMGRPFAIEGGTIFLASSKSMTLTVTEQGSETFYPGHALPTDYWSRPIDPQLREWYSISGNWVERPANSYVMYQENAPETPHVLWNMPEEMGGLTGGLFDGDNQIPAASYAGDAYEGRFSSSVVINGVLFYNTAPSGTYAQVGVTGIQAVDLHTGEKLWFKSGPVLSFGQTMFYPSYNVNGVYNYLWSVNGANYTAYSPTDGSFQFMFTNMPSGTRVFGPNGEILIYQINAANGWLALWNSTLAGLQNAVMGQPSYGSWSFGVLGMDKFGRGPRDIGGPSNPTNAVGEQTGTAFPVTRCLNGSLPQCYSWNVTIPKGLTGTPRTLTTQYVAYQSDRLVAINFNQTMVRNWALPVNDITATRNASINTQSISTIYDKTWAAPAEWYDGNNMIYYTGASSYVSDKTYGDGVIALWSKELTTHYGFSLKDGSYLWATEPENYLDLYGAGAMEHTWYFAYGKLYSVGLAGILYAYDMKTGEIDWTYAMHDAYGEPVTGENWWGWIDVITDGKIYMGTLEHSANNPIPRGGPYTCINATDGSEIFRINGLMRETRWGGNPVMGDSIITGFDTYDLQIYAMGKGPTKITASAPDASVELGKSVVIKGTVLDNSPGTASTDIKLRFPNGVPAVSDASQSQWMMYVYKQFEQPTNASGVPVAVSVVDANGNYRVVGTTTSDATGYYSLNWTPDIAGKYTVYVTFDGSKAYYGSAATNSFVVDPAAATATPQPPQQQGMADTYFLPAIAGLFVAIIICIVLVALVLLKKH